MGVPSRFDLFKKKMLDHHDLWRRLSSIPELIMHTQATTHMHTGFDLHLATSLAVTYTALRPTCLVVVWRAVIRERQQIRCHFGLNPAQIGPNAAVRVVDIDGDVRIGCAASDRRDVEHTVDIDGKAHLDLNVADWGSWNARKEEFPDQIAAR